MRHTATLKLFREFVLFQVIHIMLHTNCTPCHRHFSVRSVRISRVPVIVIYLLTFVTALDAAALNRTGQEASQLLPADQLPTGDVQKGAQESNVEQVNSL